MEYCDCPICSEKDCKVCLEPQNCDCKCGTCEDTRVIYLESIEPEQIDSEMNETIAQLLMDEISNDIEKESE